MSVTMAVLFEIHEYAFFVKMPYFDKFLEFPRDVFSTLKYCTLESYIEQVRIIAFGPFYFYTLIIFNTYFFIFNLLFSFEVTPLIHYNSIYPFAGNFIRWRVLKCFWS